MSGFGGDLDVAVGSVTGARTWLYHPDNKKLVGLFGIDWEPSKDQYTAQCHSPFSTGDVIPVHDTPPNFEFPCGCGFYAYWRIDNDRLDGPNIVVGVIEGTGRTLIGGLGFRSQYARIKGLATLMHEDGVKEILREKYGVPVYGNAQELLQAHPTTQDYYREPEVKIKRSITSLKAVTAQINWIKWYLRQS